MAELIKSELGLETTLIKKSGGLFEIAMDGIPVYSKKATGTFPNSAQIIKILKGKIT